MKRIILILSEHNLSVIRSNLEQNHIASDKIIITSDVTQYNKEECLLITDNDSISKELMKSGYAVLGYPGTEQNRMEYPHYIIEDMSFMEWEDLEEIFDRLIGKPRKVLETDRCIIREISMDDVDRLYELYSSPGITDYMEPLFKDPEEEKEYTKSYIRNIYGLYGYGMWIIEDKENQTVIGRAGLETKEEPILTKNGSASSDTFLELGYMIGKHYQRHGYAREVCRAIIEYAFDVLKADKVYSIVEMENIPSRMLCETLGFSKIRTYQRNNKTMLLYETDQFSR